MSREQNRFKKEKVLLERESRMLVVLRGVSPFLINHINNLNQINHINNSFSKHVPTAVLVIEVAFPVK